MDTTNTAHTTLRNTRTLGTVTLSSSARIGYTRLQTSAGQDREVKNSWAERLIAALIEEGWELS